MTHKVLLLFLTVITLVYTQEHHKRRYEHKRLKHRLHYKHHQAGKAPWLQRNHVNGLLNVIMTQRPPVRITESEESGKLVVTPPAEKTSQEEQENGNTEQEKIHKYNQQYWDKGTDPLEAMHWFDNNGYHHVLK